MPAPASVEEFRSNCPATCCGMVCITTTATRTSATSGPVTVTSTIVPTSATTATIDASLSITPVAITVTTPAPTPVPGRTPAPLSPTHCIDHTNCGSSQYCIAGGTCEACYGCSTCADPGAGVPIDNIFPSKCVPQFGRPTDAPSSTAQCNQDSDCNAGDYCTVAFACDRCQVCLAADPVAGYLDREVAPIEGACPLSCSPGTKNISWPGRRPAPAPAVTSPRSFPAATSNGTPAMTSTATANPEDTPSQSATDESTFTTTSYAVIVISAIVVVAVVVAVAGGSSRWFREGRGRSQVGSGGDHDHVHQVGIGGDPKRGYSEVSGTLSHTHGYRGTAAVPGLGQMELQRDTANDDEDGACGEAPPEFAATKKSRVAETQFGFVARASNGTLAQQHHQHQHQRHHPPPHQHQQQEYPNQQQQPGLQMGGAAPEQYSTPMQQPLGVGVGVGPYWGVPQHMMHMMPSHTTTPSVTMQSAPSSQSGMVHQVTQAGMMPHGEQSVSMAQPQQEGQPWQYTLTGTPMSQMQMQPQQFMLMQQQQQQPPPQDLQQMQDLQQIQIQIQMQMQVGSWFHRAWKENCTGNCNVF